MSVSTGLPPARPQAQRARAIEAFERGERSYIVARELDIPEGTIRSWRAIWRKKGGKVKPTSEAAILQRAESAEVESPELDTLGERQEFFIESASAAAVRLAAHVKKLDGEALVKNADKLHKALASARASLKLDTDRPASVIQIGVLCQPVRPAKRDDGRLRSTHNPAVLLEAESAD